MAKQLFRKVALERMASPEQLDQSIRVIKPGGWLALLGVFLLFVAVIVWSVIGIVPDKVIGNGILISSGDLDSINSPATGTVKNVFVNQGDIVRNGQIIARLQRTDLLDQLQLSIQNLENLEEEYQSTMESSSSGISGRKTPETRNELIEQRDELAETVRKLHKLSDEGLVTKQQLMNSQGELSSLNMQIQDLDRSIMTLEQRIDEARKNIEIQQVSYKDQTRVVSNLAGIISEVSVKEGDYISVGTSIAKIESSDSNVRNIQAILYYDAKDGKKIKRGMNVAISPSTIKQEEYGYIQGIVTSVSTYPISRQSLMKNFQNESLATLFGKIGAPIEVKAALIPDPSTYSMYKWSSSGGPDITIDSGLICTGSVTVSQQTPLSLVIPLLKQKVFGIGVEQEMALKAVQ